MNLLTNDITCSEHQTLGIEINTKTFQIFCSVCETEGRSGIENLRLSESEGDELLSPEKLEHEKKNPIIKILIQILIGKKILLRKNFIFVIKTH